ncbi:plasmid mobilization relaxosome protein MobC [Mucilaginibacter rigui]|uniref:Plasmid mobilization relaxosome protein MobC n=1 Tax=Mucilaginibacter rigui TaxID=534635 RepID=A0ABR7X5U9_9SPHI|nr:plasmid mobilization relaxosome protein MobC [Mucilaginibacter rigui]MBD1385876.1 plasmid mobilization relaxosome protein MobC [Mucilaginibacter rigui]
MVEFRNSGGRPKMKDGTRVKKIDVRFTQEEYDIITGLEKELGISKTELIRLRVLNDAVKIVINASQLICVLDRIGADIGRAGNNINQLAKHANTLKLKGALSPQVAVQFNNLLEDYIAIQVSLESAIRKIIQQMGK